MPAVHLAGTRAALTYYVAARPLDRVPQEIASRTRGPWVLVVPQPEGLGEAADRRRPAFEVAGLFGYPPRAGSGVRAA
jgi:hypothetical protein